MYQRKTRDEFSVYGYYGGGWEELTTEETFREGRERLKEYRENAPGIAFKLKRHRVHIEA